jgi:hypothetical protein
MLPARLLLFAQDKLPDVGLDNPLVLYGGGGAVVFVLIVIVILSRGRKKIDPEEGLAEDLSTIPKAAEDDRNSQLFLMNQPVRLRLAVVAPAGKKDVGNPGAVLEQVLRGLGEAARDDKPRTRVWPPQLSVAGFAPTFFRLVRRPGSEAEASRWVLLAGPARAGGVPVLVGLAVRASSPVKVGQMILTETQWGEVLRVGEA